MLVRKIEENPHGNCNDQDQQLRRDRFDQSIFRTGLPETEAKENQQTYQSD